MGGGMNGLTQVLISEFNQSTLSATSGRKQCIPRESGCLCEEHSQPDSAFPLPRKQRQPDPGVSWHAIPELPRDLEEDARAGWMQIWTLQGLLNLLYPHGWIIRGHRRGFPKISFKAVTRPPQHPQGFLQGFLVGADLD